MLRSSFRATFIIFSFFLFISWTHKVPVLKNGYWRTTIERPDGHEIVFNFQTKDSGGKKVLYVLNADEKLLVDNIHYKGDSVFIQMPFFESGFRAKIDREGNLSGIWVKNLGNRDQVLPFRSEFNKRQRFPATVPPAYNISGRWAVNFHSKDGGETPSVGEFVQQQSTVKGTFLTPTGDYRYLEGNVIGDSLKLSGFDGGHAFLFVAKIDNNETISGGVFYSGVAGVEEWKGRKDPNAKLPDGYDETHLRNGEHKLNFSYKSIDGKTVSLNDPVYKNKVIIIQIMGSWCPNCMDETNFLSRYYRDYKKRGIEIIALAYERTTDFEKSKRSMQLFQKRFKVSYPMLITGVTVNDPHKTEKTLPQLDEIKGFPTSIFVDKKGNVRKIYTGFEGPGTGEHYVQFQREFNDTVNSLLSEK